MVIAVIQISVQVYDHCQTYYSKVRDAKKDIARLSDEMKALQGVLVKVADLAKAPNSTKELSTLTLLNQPEGPVQKCLTEVIALSARLNPGQRKEQMKSFGRRALTWPFKSKEVDRAITAIGRQRDMFDFALSADQAYVEPFLSASGYRGDPPFPHRP